LLEAIIFDAEGVVIDTEGVWDLAQAELLRGHGKEYDRPAIKPLVAGLSQPEAIRVLKRECGLDGTIKSLLAERQSLFWKHLHRELKFVAGFEDFIARIDTGTKRAIATSMPRNMLEVVNKMMQLDRYFGPHLYSASDIPGPGKPAPDLFLFAARRIGAEPAQCVVIEDAPIGIEAATRAGMRSIGFASTFPRELLQSADLVVDRFDDLSQSVLDAVASQVRG
jgi:beta-phosphoglucomutase-like phosphatase (HAD superfamily)